MKRWITALVLSLAVLTVATAGGSGQTKGGKRTLLFWDLPQGGPEYTAEAKRLCEVYTQQTGQAVEIQQIPWEGFVQVFVTAVTANNGPDVSTGGSFQQHRLDLMGEIEPVDDLLATYRESDFVPGTVKNFGSRGRQIAIPINCDFWGIAYRKDLFQAAGITKLPTNWDEFYEAAKKLTHGEQYGYVQAGAGAEANWNMLFWCTMNGGAYLDGNMNPCMATPADAQALDFLRKLYNEKLMPPGVPGYTQDEHWRAFSQGRAAMVMTSPDVSSIDPAILDKTGLLPVMTSPAGLKQNVGATNGIMLYSDSKIKEEGKKFMDWWSKNTITLWSKGDCGPFPARLSLYSDPYFQNDPIKKQFADLIMPFTVQNSWPHESKAVEMDVMEGELYYAQIVQRALTSPNIDSMNVLREGDERYARAIEQLRRSIR